MSVVPPTEHGAFIPPSDVYCDPEKADTHPDLEIRPAEELEGSGMRRCPFCFDDTDTTRPEGGVR